MMSTAAHAEEHGRLRVPATLPIPLLSDIAAGLSIIFSKPFLLERPLLKAISEAHFADRRHSHGEDTP